MIEGGAGGDSLNAGDGNDTLRAADGEPDTVNCGPGSDSATVDSIDTVNADCEPTPLHFRVELKAWIPKAAVVVPNIPFTVPVAALLAPPLRFLAFDPLSRAPCQLVPPTPPLPTLFAGVESGFRGDAHPEYDGSFRVRPVAEFDWDGEEITNFTVSQGATNFGITILDFAYHVSDEEIIRCSRTKQQVSFAGGRQLSPTSWTVDVGGRPARLSAPDRP